MSLHRKGEAPELASAGIGPIKGLLILAIASGGAEAKPLTIQSAGLEGGDENDSTCGAPLSPHPLWILLPWGVFAVAAAVKFWRLSQPIRQRLARQTRSTEQARASLERLWHKDEQTA